MKAIEINKNNYGQRIDKFILKLLPGMSKSFCYKMFRKKNIKLNKKKIQGSELLEDGDLIEVFFADATYEQFASGISGGESSESHGDKLDVSEVTLPEVIYEDDQILVVNKKEGIFAQNDPQGISVTQQIEKHYMNCGTKLELGVLVGVSNRLDRNTTGVMISGKTLPIIQGLNLGIKEREVKKYYRTIVVGQLNEVLELKGYLTKDGGLNKVSVSTVGETMIHTIVKPIRSCNGYTEVEVDLRTGKTHQIRAHMSSIGCPVIGDAKYGIKSHNDLMKKRYGLKHQLLHAYSYEFTGEFLKEQLTETRYVAPIPTMYKKIARNLFEVKMC